jgi:mRNA interferase MazF
MKRGDVWLADLNPVRGSEQAGIRPVVVIQSDAVSARFQTRVVVPFASSLHYQSLPFCVLVRAGEGGLTRDSLALCHQTRVCDNSRLIKFLGRLTDPLMAQIEEAVRNALEL